MDKVIMPLGIDSFEKIRSGDYYYIDKTGLISELFRKTFEVNLITRPRRFGKTLAMDTLACFFDICKDTRQLFEGLEVSYNKDLCALWQNQWPVISLTLKEVDSDNFHDAKKNFSVCVSDLYQSHACLLDSDRVDERDKEQFRRYLIQDTDTVSLQNSLYVLMRMMNAHWGRPVIVLLDEYDVPLARASESGFYDEMLNLIRGLMNKTFKTNPFLKFAVITGCLRIANESIFTGTNNFVSDTIAGERFNEYFGFTEKNVAKLLKDTGFEDRAEEMRLWYNGYHFGTVNIYCPWDVLNHINAIQDAPQTPPKSYWENTSHNGILRTFIELANNGLRPELDVNDKFETLLSGGYIEEPIEENLTYDALHSSESNLWSLLYLTGYLTQVSPSELPEGCKAVRGNVFLKIPNEEIKLLFRKTVVSWFNDKMIATDRSELFCAMWLGDDKKTTEMISDILFTTISYHDYKEDFYHAFVAGLFTGAGYIVKSNREQGYGRADIIIRDRRGRRVMLIEAKHADSFSRLEAECMDAVKQIDDRRYAQEFEKGYLSVICYGMAFYDKQCLVKKFDERKHMVSGDS